MPVLIAVVVAAVVAFVVIVVAAWFSETPTAPGDPTPSERWLVDRLARYRRRGAVVRVFDRHLWGGAMVGIGLLALIVAGALVGWLFTTIDSNRGFARFDQSVAEWGSAHASGFSTDALSTITYGGASGLLIAVMVVVGVVELVRSPRRNWSILGFLLTVGVGIVLVDNGLKLLVDRDRPPVVHLVAASSSSFPSGHSGASAACWAALALVVSRHVPMRSHRWLAAGAVAIAVLVASSRVLLGVHWLTDVIAGLVIGWTWFFLAALVFGGRMQRFGMPVESADGEEPPGGPDGAASVR